LSGWYDRVVVPWLIELACGSRRITEQRAKLIPQARGRVLELGFGPGHNLPLYDTSKVTEVVGVDPSPAMPAKARPRAAAAGLRFSPLLSSAESLPLDDASFDTVVCTYTLCSIPDPAAALKEARRALKPGGELLFDEHGRSPDAAVARRQDRFDSWWPKVAGGCHLNRDIPALLREAGFRIQELETAYLPGPRPWTWHFRGRARPAPNS
jgi:ubiquinone/menaquinone biosynthesis C-methylase UbiE